MINDLYQVPSHFVRDEMDHGDYMHEIDSGTLAEMVPDLWEQIHATGYIHKMNEQDTKAAQELIVKFVNLRTREIVCLTASEAANLVLVSHD
jgi:hypothetical protein